jgi:two-component system sensor histidine kinase RegB
MTLADPPLPSRESARAVAPGRLRLRTLVAIRWAAVLGQAAAVLVVELGMGFELPLAPVATTIFAAAVANVILAVTRPAQARLTDRQVRSTWPSTSSSSPCCCS